MCWRHTCSLSTSLQNLMVLMFIDGEIKKKDDDGEQNEGHCGSGGGAKDWIGYAY